MCIIDYHYQHPITIHVLNEDDPQARVEFSRQFLEGQNKEDKFVDKIIWSDESIFTINGHLNRHNTVYWSITNPDIVLEEDKLGPKVMVWAGIWSTGRVGPYFFNGSVNANNYLKLLDDFVWPSISNKVARERLWFQQDGAPAHFANTVRDWLNRYFQKRWIGRGSEMTWPPRSPDLTTADFFSLEVFKAESLYETTKRFGNT